MQIDFNDITPQERRMLLVASDEKYTELINRFDFGKMAIYSIFGG